MQWKKKAQVRGHFLALFRPWMDSSSVQEPPRRAKDLVGAGSSKRSLAHTPGCPNSPASFEVSETRASFLFSVGRKPAATSALHWFENALWVVSQRGFSPRWFHGTRAMHPIATFIWPFEIQRDRARRCSPRRELEHLGSDPCQHSQLAGPRILESSRCGAGAQAL